MVKDTSLPLSPKQIKRVMDVVSTLLYYVWAVGPMLATALSTIPSAQAKETEATKAACNQILDYVATHPNATLRYVAIHLDASYPVNHY